MAESDWEWNYASNTGFTNIKCKLCYGKPKGYAKFIKVYPDDYFTLPNRTFGKSGSDVVTMDFEKLNEYYPMKIHDTNWDMLKVGYDLFLISKKRDMLKNKWKGGLTYD